MHQHIIGLLHDFDYSYLVSLEGLKEHIQENMHYNEWLDEDPVFKKYDDMKVKVWSIKDYADKRKFIGFERFEFCPVCGVKINWDAIKSSDDVRDN